MNFLMFLWGANLIKVFLGLATEQFLFNTKNKATENGTRQISSHWYIGNLAAFHQRFQKFNPHRIGGIKNLMSYM